MSSNQPPSQWSIANRTDPCGPVGQTSTWRAAGAHKRKRTLPSSRHSEPNGMLYRRFTGFFLLAISATFQQHDHGPRLQWVGCARVVGIDGAQTVFSRSIHPWGPADTSTKRRQNKSNIFVVRIQKNEEVFVPKFPSAFISLIQSLPGEKHSQTVKRRIAPLLLAHLVAAGIEPQQIFYICPLDRTTLEKTAPAKYGMPLPQVDHALYERQQVTILRLQIPI